VAGTSREAEQALAAQFVEARLRAASLARYPGDAPDTLAAAYAVQDAAISLWPDQVAGWKVGLVQPRYRASFGAERIAGPIFKGQIAHAERAGVSELPMIAGGFGAVEAEFVLAVGREPAPDKLAWTPEEALACAGGMFIGIEFAGSPFAGINDLGPAVTASDFGNNAGLVLGGEVEDWRDRALSELTAQMRIDGDRVGSGSALDVPGGPLAAFAFILGHCAARGIALKVGDLVSTGAVTGVHAVRVGQTAEADFGASGTIACRIVNAAALQNYAASA
jgi:2-keto-4-pentenoate hydratase